jgi:RTX calcium-binding nonapeptide repeat (4 copies)
MKRRKEILQALRLGRRMGKLARTIPVVAIAATALMAAPSTASAAVTVGQIAPTPPTPICASPVDRLQPTVSAGTTYIVPANGTITSWNTLAGASSGELKMKVFRRVSGDTYIAVGHDGPRNLTVNTPNTFSTSVPVKAGDLLGLNSFSGLPNCSFVVTGDSYLRAPPDPGTGDLADGQPALFIDPVLDRRLNISAVVEPDCDNDGLGDETQDTNLSSCPGTTPTGPAPTLPSGAPASCRGVPATIVGTNGSDARTASQGRDVIVALGGNDTISGVGGNDVICGGAGKDTLRGGKGKDTLLGQKGKDALRGGGSRDFCKGGKGTDTASKCEVEKSI